MSVLNIQCQVFDPVRITTLTRAERFIIDTWFSKGLMARSLHERLPGVEVEGIAKLTLSSGMSVDRPLVRVGVQINNIRALPVEFIVVDEGPAPLLLGSDFLELLFSIGRPSVVGIGSPPSPGHASIEPPPKYAPESIGIRLIPEGDSVDTLQLEKFIRAVRKIHNIGVIANSHLHQHEDWPLQSGKSEAKRRAVRETIEGDRSLSDADTLKIAWVESGSIWLSLKTGSKAAISWLAQIFEKSTDARLRATIAAAASAEEDAAIKEMTRDEIARAKTGSRGGCLPTIFVKRATNGESWSLLKSTFGKSLLKRSRTLMLGSRRSKIFKAQLPSSSHQISCRSSNMFRIFPRNRAIVCRSGRDNRRNS
jgi:hypothetical protein